ncbi:MAG: O-antigen ligase C-terminal domain-containing protein [Polaromonas sp.]|uniref:PglL family O-oligosaccharyltransferase n=1 Tax=Polaromonas sp. TaxID=1869339 RepID=UPI0025EBE947|nr:Wzy polymerase domain-containing protein [Polaromonas sp.]MBI2725719.1 O-antigen ligase C-terminal domain-containing protein [Polaromonas sp.]
MVKHTPTNPDSHGHPEPATEPVEKNRHETENRASRALVPLVCAALVIFPWINPFAPGPSPAVVPLLLSALCAAILLGMSACWPALFKVERLVWPVASAWLFAGLVSSVLGLIQYFGAADGLLPWVNQSRYGEAFANLRQRNQFASLTNIAMIALVWFGVMFSRSKHVLDARRTRNYQILMVMAAALLACGNATSVSRTGMIQLGLLCGLCVLWGQWRHASVRWILLAAVVVYAVSVLALPRLAGFDLLQYSMSGRLRAGDPVCASRLTLWSNVLHLVAMKPWLGWGWGELDFAHYTELYQGPRFCDILDNAHNFPLHLAVERGVPFALLVCGAFALWIWRRKPWLDTDPARQMAWSVLAILLFHSMLEYPLWYGPFQMAVVLCLLFVRKPLAISQEGQPGRSFTGVAARAGCAALSVLLLLGTFYAMWDYRRVSQIYLAADMRDPAYRTDTLEKISDSWLFSDQVMFARLLVTPLTQANAAWTFSTAQALLHYSPEPRVAEKLIESAVMLGRDEEAQAHMLRYRVAFPKEYALWKPLKANQELQAQ